MSWFKELTGFEEGGYAETRQRLKVCGEHLHCNVNGQRWAIGRLETPSLGQLRERARSDPQASGRLTVRAMASDAKGLHAHPDSCGALFQVASQFNLLEMLHHSVTPEDGVTRYEDDPTQGPACAIAAGAATIYRNYFAPVGGPDGPQGQTAECQINTLADLSAALGEGLVDMRNGYALCTAEQLQQINQRVAALTEPERGALRDLLRIGLHWDVEVTTAGAGRGQRVSQALCSALPVAYSQVPAAHWAPLARLVLEAAYEATMWAAVLNARRGPSNAVYLTLLGGGAFGNDARWIQPAMERALECVADQDLAVHLVSYRHIPEAFHDLERRYRARRP